MFILTTISDVIHIEPIDFRKKTAVALEDNINEKYANKVIQKIGLCICFYDLLWASEGLIGHGDGIVNVNAHFRLVVFRPFKGEVLEGTVGESTPKGINIQLEFFSDVYVPAARLFTHSVFDERDKVWKVDRDKEFPLDEEIPAAPTIEHDTSPSTIPTSESTAPATALPPPAPSTDESAYMWFDKGERVRFRVEEEYWVDQPPVVEDPAIAAERRRAQMASLGIGNASAMDAAHRTVGEGLPLAGTATLEPNGESAGMSPWRIVGSMMQSGLGCNVWWQDADTQMNGSGEGSGLSSETATQAADEETTG